ncbi:MAG: glycosyltransferase [Clostridia bacterium]|nr:glycosyltransferase [Clostridia bacterium]
MVITPKFSVVVPVYKAEDYIEQCITSVLSQNETDLELILVDDGSPDESGHICDRFALRDSRVKVIHQQNAGHLAARMSGVSKACGDHILFLDSDDYWYDGLLKTVSDKVDEFGCEVLVFRLKRGEEICHDFFGGERENITHEDYFSVSLAESGMNSLVIKAFSRRLFENVDISSFSQLRNSEDLVLSTLLIRSAKHISYIPDVLYYYRPNENSITNNLNKKALDEFVVSRGILWAELEKLGLDNIDNKKVLYSGFLRRAADHVFQVSVSSMSYAEKTECFDQICRMDIFAEAMKNVDLSQFGKAKQLRLRLLSCGRYKTLLMLDKIRKTV